MLGVYVGLSRDSEQKALELIHEIFEEIKRDGVTADELHRTKEQLKTTLLMGMESTASRMSTIARNEMIYGREVSEDELIAGIDSVTSEDIKKLANRVFDYSRGTLSAVGNVARKSEYASLLKTGKISE